MQLDIYLGALPWKSSPAPASCSSSCGTWWHGGGSRWEPSSLGLHRCPKGARLCSASRSTSSVAVECLPAVGPTDRHGTACRLWLSSPLGRHVLCLWVPKAVVVTTDIACRWQRIQTCTSAPQTSPWLRSSLLEVLRRSLLCPLAAGLEGHCPRRTFSPHGSCRQCSASCTRWPPCCPSCWKLSCGPIRLLSKLLQKPVLARRPLLCVAVFSPLAGHASPSRPLRGTCLATPPALSAGRRCRRSCASRSWPGRSSRPWWCSTCLSLSCKLLPSAPGHKTSSGCQRTAVLAVQFCPMRRGSPSVLKSPCRISILVGPANALWLWCLFGLTSHGSEENRWK